MKQAILFARIVFGGWMLLTGINHFTLALWPEPVGHGALAVQLMSALVHSGLLDVAMGMLTAAGALILAGFFVPLALCVAMPICVCAAYWAVILEREPLGALLALAAVALNAALLFAHLDSFGGMLHRQSVALGEAPERGATYEAQFVDITGRSARPAFLGALIQLAAAAIFYHYLVFGRTGQWAMLMMLFPAIVLYARRLRDMGRTAWLLLIPAVVVAAAVWFRMFAPGFAYEREIVLAALGIGGLFTLWGLLAPTMIVRV